ncbi:hypothetical protein HerbRD11066_03910 [Herbidospora sp. RD11066]
MSFIVVAAYPFSAKHTAAASSTAERVRRACSSRRGDRYLLDASGFLATVIMYPFKFDWIEY